MPKYKAAAYIRLSYTDDRSSESDSVGNQRMLIENFAENHPDIELVMEKIDDGYSGIIFDRPAFKEMMQEVADGSINCVIVKDSSRFGRNASESGRYIGVGSSSTSGVLTTSTSTAYANTLSFSDGDVNIYTTYGSGWSSYTYYMRYYDYSTSSRFRYYRSTTGNYKPVALYKKVKLTYDFGDVNKDGNVNWLDVPTLAGYLAGNVSASDIDLTAADVNCDGTISLADLTTLVNLLKARE